MTIEFYDKVAPFYHLLYADWEQSMERQAYPTISLLHFY